MTVLPDHEIRWFCLERNLIEPFDRDQLQPASYDTKLAKEILVPVPGKRETDTRKPSSPQRTRRVDISDGYELVPSRFILGSTVEWVNVPPSLVARIEGKSSRARQGIQIHSAGYIDPGFHGNVTLEIVNFSPYTVILYPDILIAQLSFAWLSSDADQPYSSERNHYQDSHGVIDSRIEGEKE
jgi:dCTP deaminase